MFVKNKYSIYELPIVPEGATFKIGYNNFEVLYAKTVLENGREILYLFKDEWFSTNMTIDEYNSIYVKQANEYNIHEIIKSQVPVWAKHGKLLYIFKNDKGNIVISYNKPVKKNKQINGVSSYVIKAGETATLNYSFEKMSYYDELVKIGVLDNFYVEVKYNENKVKFEYTYNEYQKYQEWLSNKA